MTVTDFYNFVNTDATTVEFCFNVFRVTVISSTKKIDFTIRESYMSFTANEQIFY